MRISDWSSDVCSSDLNPDVQLRAADYLREQLGRNYVVALNLASTVPGWLRAIGASPMNLGLDLQGGVHFLMQVDQRAAIDTRENAYADDIRTALRDARIGYNAVKRSLGQILIELRDPDASDKSEKTR